MKHKMRMPTKKMQGLAMNRNIMTMNLKTMTMNPSKMTMNQKMMTMNPKLRTMAMRKIMKAQTTTTTVKIVKIPLPHAQKYTRVFWMDV